MQALKTFWIALIITIVPALGASAAPVSDVAAPAAAAQAAHVTCDAPAAPTVAGLAQILPVVPTNHPVLNPCPGIRPGGALILRAGPLDFVYCSMAFIVRSGADLYVSTAGHCVDASLGVPSVGERVSALGVPGTFGTVTYQWCEGQAANGGCAAGTDFALIKIDADKHTYVKAAMCHWGAPKGGMFTAFDSELRKVQHFGWGIGIGDPSGGVGVPVGNPATQARGGLGLDFNEETFAIIESAAISGDSGSGVLVSGLNTLGDFNLLRVENQPQALGVLTHISVGGIAIVQRLDASLAKATADTGKSYTLVTA